MISYKKIDNQIFLLENEQSDTSYTYNQDEFDKIIPVQFARDYYDYNKPHGQIKTNTEKTWRLITCMFGVIICKCNEYEFEISRENKKQIVIGPTIRFEYYNKSGKSVCHVRSSQ